MNKNINIKNRAMTMQTICRVSVSLLILCALFSCTEESLVDNGSAVGGGHTVTLRIAPTVVPISETRATVRAASPGSEAAAAGFSYELVSSDHTDSTATELFSAPVTKAPPATLKNVYALLFLSDGRFNGRALVGSISSDQVVDIKFTNVVSTTATGCRLVIVANDAAAQNSYSSSGGTGGFSTFSGTYAQFRALTMTNAVKTDADIPYAGTTTPVDIANGEVSKLVEVSLYRTLASITLSNNFNVTGSRNLTRAKVELYNAGGKRFAPVGDNYNGTSITETPVENLVASPSGANAGSGDYFHFYVGENVRPAGGSDINNAMDRNTTKAPANSSYLCITSSEVQVGANTTPKIGEEYILAGSKSFSYYIYLGKRGDLRDFSIRRNTNYTITSSITGTVNTQEMLASVDRRVTETFASGGGGGLAIGRFGGFRYTGGTGFPNSISGSYQKMLLLQPNISGTTAPDVIARRWSTSQGTYQAHARKFWDKEFIYSLNSGGLIGGMTTTDGYLHHYCQNLQVGGVPKGTWYVPTQAQLTAIYIVLEGLRYKNYSKYSAFDTLAIYWSCTECTGSSAFGMDPDVGFIEKVDKAQYNALRCVRDL